MSVKQRDAEVAIPPRRLTATIQSVRESCARWGIVDVEQSLRSSAIAEWSSDRAWLEAAAEKFALSPMQVDRLRGELRARNREIWGVYSDAE